MEETSEIPAKEVTARYYFTLLFDLANKDVTRIEEVENLPLYLCLNTAAMKKEIREQEKAEYDKIKNQMKI